MEKTAAIDALSALAHDTRLDVFRMLVRRGPEGLPVGALAERLSLPGATLSFHLARLKHARLVSARREGRSLIYSADFEAMNALMGYLTENCCGESACAPSATS
jgi:ArsR family transcriptional regulator, arsenate/arsenite/antimonite-responsive transcriptional repressor